MTLSTGLTINNAGKEEGGVQFWILLIVGEVVWISALSKYVCQSYKLWTAGLLKTFNAY